MAGLLGKTLGKNPVPFARARGEVWPESHAAYQREAPGMLTRPGRLPCENGAGTGMCYSGQRRVCAAFPRAWNPRAGRPIERAVNARILANRDWRSASRPQ